MLLSCGLHHDRRRRRGGAGAATNRAPRRGAYLLARPCSSPRALVALPAARRPRRAVPGSEAMTRPEQPKTDWKPALSSFLWPLVVGLWVSLGQWVIVKIDGTAAAVTPSLRESASMTHAAVVIRTITAGGLLYGLWVPLFLPSRPACRIAPRLPYGAQRRRLRPDAGAVDLAVRTVHFGLSSPVLAGRRWSPRTGSGLRADWSSASLSAATRSVTCAPTATTRSPLASAGDTSSVSLVKRSRSTP